MKPLDILITIHALSEWNELGQRQGHCDSELSETGRHMAISLSRRSDIVNVKTIYTSDLKRAYHTALPLSERIGIPIVTTPYLREGNWGHFSKFSNHPLFNFQPEKSQR